MKWFWAKKSKEIEELAEHLDTALKIRLGAISEIGGYMNPIARPRLLPCIALAET